MPLQHPTWTIRATPAPCVGCRPARDLHFGDRFGGQFIGSRELVLIDRDAIASHVERIGLFFRGGNSSPETGFAPGSP